MKATSVSEISDSEIIGGKLVEGRSEDALLLPRVNVSPLLPGNSLPLLLLLLRCEEKLLLYLLASGENEYGGLFPPPPVVRLLVSDVVASEIEFVVYCEVEVDVVAVGSVVLLLRLRLPRLYDLEKEVEDEVVIVGVSTLDSCLCGRLRLE